MSKQIQLKKAVLLVNLGTPEAPTPKAVRRFLRQFLSDRRVVDLPRALWLPILYGIILPFRGRASARNYQKIWTEQGSPLMHYSKRLVEQLQAQSGSAVQVKLAMCYGEPSIKTVLSELKQHAIDDLLVIPMYPQYSSTTTAAIYDQIFKHLQHWRWVPSLRFISQYADQPRFIEAIAQSIDQHFTQFGKPDRLLMSFHGIPQRLFDSGDPYYCYCHKTARLIAQQLQLSEDEWQLVFQSRFGREPWLQPYCDQTLEQLPSQGVKSVAVVCPGFAVDCLETVEEIAITNQELFKAAGGQEYHYIPALNDSLAHVELFKEFIEDSKSQVDESIRTEAMT